MDDLTAYDFDPTDRVETDPPDAYEPTPDDDRPVDYGDEDFPFSGYVQ